jgi:hypothetical protein
MEPELAKKIDELEKKIDAVYKSAEKTRKYFMWTLIISIVVIVLPMIGLAFLIPYYLKTLNLGGLGL